MARSDGVVQFIRETACADAADAELVERFVTGRDEGAFRALVSRYGSIVWAVCRKVLRDHHQAEDAFQATLVVFARRAGTLRAGAAVGGWLHAVAYRVAARSRAARRGEVGVPEFADAGPDALALLTTREAEAALHTELAALPERYRAPLVLCCLEGLSRDEAAARLGWPTNRVKHGLERGRELLRTRLARRGLAFGVPLLLNLLGQTGGAVPPAELVGTAISYATGAAPPGAVAALVNGVTRTMWIAKWKWPVVACGGLVLTVGILAATLRDRSDPPATASRSQTVPAGPPEDAAPKPEPAAPKEEQPKQPWDVASYFLRLSIDGKVEPALKLSSMTGPAFTGLQQVDGKDRIESIKRMGLARVRFAAVLINDTRVLAVTERANLKNGKGDDPLDAHVAVVLRREQSGALWKVTNCDRVNEERLVSLIGTCLDDSNRHWGLTPPNEDMGPTPPWEVARKFLTLSSAARTEEALKLTAPGAVSAKKLRVIAGNHFPDPFPTTGFRVESGQSLALGLTYATGFGNGSSIGEVNPVAVLLGETRMDVCFNYAVVSGAGNGPVRGHLVLTLVKSTNGHWLVKDYDFRTKREDLLMRFEQYLENRHDNAPK